MQYNFSHHLTTEFTACSQAAITESAELLESADLPDPCSQATPIYMLSMTSLVQNISIGQLGSAVPAVSPSSFLCTSQHDKLNST